MRAADRSWQDGSLCGGGLPVPWSTTPQLKPETPTPLNHEGVLVWGLVCLVPSGAS